MGSSRYELNRSLISRREAPTDESWSLEYLFSFFAPAPASVTSELSGAQALLSQLQRKQAWHTNTKDILAAEIEFIKEYKILLLNLGSYKYLEPIATSVHEFCKAHDDYANRAKFIPEVGPERDALKLAEIELEKMRAALALYGLDMHDSIENIKTLPGIIRNAFNYLTDKERIDATFVRQPEPGYLSYDVPVVNERNMAILTFIYAYDRLQMEYNRLDFDTRNIRKDELQIHSDKLVELGIVPNAFILKLEAATLDLLFYDINKKYTDSLVKMEDLAEQGQEIAAEVAKAKEAVAVEAQQAADSLTSRQVLNSRKEDYRRV